MAKRVASASTVAEPVVSVTHQIRANIATRLPRSDSAWPPQMVKNGARQALEDDGVAAVDMVFPLFKMVA